MLIFYFTTVIDIGFENISYSFDESVNVFACLTICKFSNPPILTDSIEIRFLTMDGTAEGKYLRYVPSIVYVRRGMI